MAGFFSEEFIEDVRARNDIVDVVSGYVRLTKKGRNYWGLCPFHPEKTPSFSVSPEKEMYYCFGCHVGGSVFQFIQNMERCDFPDAVKLLAERAGVELPQSTRTGGESRRDALYEACRQAALFFHQQLYTPAGRQALAYLHRRGLDERMITRFGLGWAPDDGDALLRHLEGQRIPFDALRQAYLAGEKNGRRYDFFRGRVMFPVIDRKNRVIAFGGRVMDKSQPKYINTPETPIFHKRENLYGINLVHKLRRLDKLFIVEGYMDVVSLHMAGIPYAVASLGTALTVEQARLMKRYTRSIYLGYDGDRAGQSAMNRGGDILRAEGLDARVVTFPEGLDPDDFARANGQAGIADLLQEALPLNDYFLKILANEYDLHTPDGRIKYVARCCRDVLSKLESPVEREGYMQQLSRLSGISAPAIAEELNRLGGGTAAPRPAYRQAAPVAPDKPTPPARQDAGTKAEESIVALALHSAAQRDEMRRSVTADDFTTPALRELAAYLLSDGALSAHALETALTPEARAEWSRIAIGHDERLEAPGIFDDCVKELHLRRLSRRIHAVNDELNKNGALDEQTRSQLKRQLAQALQQQAALRGRRGG
ncbi:MAG: DNA primase [Eubacteriales bacterium]|nr:DNA primase [Eubacteriales bacterium]